MIVKVGHNHIEDGERGCPNSCAVALAVSEASGYYCEVGHDYILVHGAHRAYYDTPQPVREWIDRFDGGTVVEPFEFELTAESTMGD